MTSISHQKFPPETIKRIGKIIRNNILQDTSHKTTKGDAPWDLRVGRDVSLIVVPAYCFVSRPWPVGQWGRDARETRRSLMDSHSWERELRVWRDQGGRSFESVVPQRWKYNNDTTVEIWRGSSSLQQSTNQSMDVRKLPWTWERTTCEVDRKEHWGLH